MDLLEVWRLMAEPERTPTPDAAALLADPAGLRARIQAEKARRSGSRSFYAFVQQGWLYVPRVEPLELNWHVKAVCDHFEEVAYGRISKLVVNIPPGHAKSVIASVLFPAWVWSWWPKAQMLFFSYSDEYVRRDSDRCREVITSDWYQETYCEPSGWNLRGDYGGVTNFQNTAGGERVATSTHGKGGGLRAHIIVGDDPLNIGDAHSKAARDEANNFIGQTISQRWVDKRKPRFALVMQRLHEEDPSQFVLAGKDAEHLRLPAEFDDKDPAVTHHQVANDDGPPIRLVFWRDPRALPADDRPADVHPVLLFPQRFPREVLDASKKPNELGIDGFEAQCNQRPRSFAGGMFARVDWRFYRRHDAVQSPNWQALRPRGSSEEPAAQRPAMFDRVIMSVDCAFKANPSGSRVAIHVWGRAGRMRCLLFRRTELLDFPATCRALVEVAAMFPACREKFIEDAANGPAVLAQLKEQGVTGLIPVTPSMYGSKEARAAAAQPYQRAHDCFLPEGDPGMEEFVGTMAGFPKGTMKDDVDAYSQAMLKFEEQPEGEVGTVNWNRR